MLGAGPGIRELASDGPAGGRRQCELLGRWGSFGWWLQGFLGVVCLCSLVAKRFTDRVRRPWTVWFMDTSKQVVQAVVNHLVNIGLSKAFGEWLDTTADPCNWYWINLSLDCTLGVAILLLLLRLLQCLYRKGCVGRPELARVGDYGNPPDKALFLRQLGDWQGLVFIQKCIIAGFVVSFQTALATMAEVLLGWLDAYPRAKLLIVMVVTPLALNVFALWTADSFLQGNGLDGRAEELQAREALVGAAAANGRRAAGAGAQAAGAARGAFEELSEEEDRLVSFEEWKQRVAAEGRAVAPVPQRGAGVELAASWARSFVTRAAR